MPYVGEWLESDVDDSSAEEATGDSSDPFHQMTHSTDSEPSLMKRRKQVL